MSLLFGKPKKEDRSSGYWLDQVNHRASRGSSLPLDEKNLMSHSAVFSCVDLLADTISSFPTERYKKGPEEGLGASKVFGGADMVEDPSDESVIDHVNWKRLVMVMWLLRGYAPAIVTGVNPRYPTIPASLELINPDRVSFHKTRQDSPWRYFLDDKEVQLWPRGRLWIANGKMMWPTDPVGRSVLEFAAVESGLGMYARKFANDYFKGGGHPTGIIQNEKSPKQMNAGQGFDETAAKLIKQKFMDALNGGREPVVMTDGWTFNRIQIRPEESQFLETINANRLMVCNFFRVPPQFFGISPEGGSGAITYANEADRGLGMLKYTMQPWVIRMETVLSPLTIRNEFVKLNVDELLRADTRRRYDSHALAVRAGWKSVNEVRAEEDLPPIEGGDQYLWPPNRSNPTLYEMEGDPDIGKNIPLYKGEKEEEEEPSSDEDDKKPKNEEEEEEENEEGRSWAFPDMKWS